MHLAVLTEQAELVRDLVIGGAKVSRFTFTLYKITSILTKILRATNDTKWRLIHVICKPRSFLHKYS